MANGAPPSPGLSFPRETFAKLTPGPYLHAHLKQPDPIRPNGRFLNEFRKLQVNTGSLTHGNGSAVVRSGDTTMVCGVRAEILLASNIPSPPRDDIARVDRIEQLGLVVPNLELSSGCSPAHLPGNPPGPLAQALSYRILSWIQSSDLINLDDLKIDYHEPQVEDQASQEEGAMVTKAYWALYIDILCIALDGNPFDAVWAAVMAALRDTVLPKAWWDPDQEMILCSPHRAEAKKLRLNGLPIACTYSVFSLATPLKKTEDAEFWVMADPDTFEDDVCAESLTVMVVRNQPQIHEVVRVEKSGGCSMGKDVIRRCVRLAETRWSECEAVLREL